MLERLTQEQKNWVETTFRKLTLEEKIGQMVNERAYTVLSQEDPVAYLDKYPIGSIFTGSEIIEENAADSKGTSRIQQIADKAEKNVPILFSGDFENGIGGQIEGFTTMPRTMGLSATFNKQDYYDFGKVIGSEGKAINVRWCFGPVSDLNINRENPVTNIRSAGDDPDHAVEVLKNIVKGMQDQGCAACPKHFPGDGTDTRNQHLVTSLNVLSMEEWKKMHGRVFRELIEAGAMSIMAGHIAFPAGEELDPVKQIWRPATCSKRLLTDLLRKEMGFDGVILSDALCMVGYLCWGDYETRIVDSINAGVDVLVWPDPEKFFPLVKRALADGRISMGRIEESAKRVLAFKAILGLAEKGPARMEKEKLQALLAENAKTAKRIAEDSITLLRNRDKMIPLRLPAGSRILAFIAPERPAVTKYLSRFVSHLEKRGYEVTTAKSEDMAVLRKSLKTFDCVMYLADANPQYSAYRTADPIFWNLVGNEDVKNLVVISFASPYHLYDMASVPTYINAYHDCPASVDALTGALFGEIPFKGKSPVSVPFCFRFGDGLTV